MTNRWWELQIIGHPAAEDVIFWRLTEFGCQGMATDLIPTPPEELPTLGTERALRVRAYLPEATAHTLDLSALSIWLQQDAIAAEILPPKVTWNLIREEDWSSSWKDHWEIQEIGDRFVICPAWLSVPESDRIPLRLDPGSAFGTGTHATTQLCLESLEMRAAQCTPETVLADIGCGSGILSIGAILLGAGHVYAVDTDIMSVKATVDNCNLNNIPSECLTVKQGSIDLVQAGLDDSLDGLMCNILAETIMPMIPQMANLVKPKGWAILSGILLEQAQEVSDVLEAHGWIIATLWKRGEWCCFNVRRG
ncbi:50S ribosomal protein L11 methyltransferase [Spirulina major]|uniref:50S ribosomal protein L11 methyltransferase n=1 Tax=Spirulina major TaxID=270636 RepID=UPI000933C138|nr:50S ribosomal protein L11 methyltransferase [Spirulina major]